jgi:hypothetical protein
MALFRNNTMGELLKWTEFIQHGMWNAAQKKTSVMFGGAPKRKKI